MLGYQVAIPGKNKLLNGLRWDNSVDPRTWQPGTRSTSGPPRRACAPTAWRRPRWSGPACRSRSCGAPNTARRTAWARWWRRPPRRCGAPTVPWSPCTTAQLDGTGHTFGASSDAWRYHLGHVDKLAEQLAAALPRGTPLYVTADHGMVDVGAGRPDRRGLAARAAGGGGAARRGAAGAARVRRAGRGRRRAAAWAEVIGDRAWVLPGTRPSTRAGSARWPDALAARIGDVVAAPVGPFAIVATRAEPLESSLIGMHGSLTSADQWCRCCACPPCERARRGPRAPPRSAFVPVHRGRCRRDGVQLRPQRGMPVIHSIIRGDARVCGTSSTESWDLPTGRTWCGNRHSDVSPRLRRSGASRDGGVPAMEPQDGRLAR